MSISIDVIFLCTSFFASVFGAVCGIGGGVIIKPVLDASGMLDVSMISFLSACTVLIMSLYSVGATLIKRENVLDAKTATPMAVGAAIGGVAGKEIFEALLLLLPHTDGVGRIQAGCLLLITVLTLLYTKHKTRLTTRRVQSVVACVCVGLTLGMISAFLGIGGGPMNLMVLSYFFSMDAKKAAQNSLYMILISQSAGLLSTFFQAQIPPFEPKLLLLMAVGGLGGAIIGRKWSKRMKTQAVNQWFCRAMTMIICLCMFNMVR